MGESDYREFYRKQLSYRQRHIDAGLCVRCPRPAVEGITHCQRCRAKLNKQDRMRKRRLRAKGLCTVCTQPHNNAGGYCSECLNDSKLRQRRESKARMSQGLCRYCNNKKTKKTTMCQKHLLLHRERTKLSHRRKLRKNIGENVETVS